MKNEKGFSLIELIIVIAIMAVLVAILAPNLTKYLGSSKIKTDEANLDTVKKTVEQACALTNTELAEPPSANLGTWVELKEDSDYFDSDAADVNGLQAFGKYVAETLEEVPKSKQSGKSFWVKIIGSTSTSYHVEVKIQ